MSAPTLVITGGASGFGLAVAQRCAVRGMDVAQRCAVRGMDVALLDIDHERVRDAARTIEAEHRVRAVAHRVDVTSSTDLDAAATAVAEQLGRCDLLWVNVGVVQFGAAETITDDEWRWVVDVNVIGAARTVRAFLPALRASDSPRLAFTASANALAPAERLASYQTSKFALVGLAETLRLELSHDSIPVSVVYPSGMFTRHYESSYALRPDVLGEAGDVTEDMEVMLASRAMSEIDFSSAEDAAAVAVDDVIAGEPHVITHGALEDLVTKQHQAIRAALNRAALRQA